MYNIKVVCTTARCCGHCVWHFRALGTSLICPYSCVFSVANRVGCYIYCFHSTAGLVGIYGNVTGLCVKKHDYSRLGDVQCLPSDVSPLGGSVLPKQCLYSQKPSNRQYVQKGLCCFSVQNFYTSYKFSIFLRLQILNYPIRSFYTGTNPAINGQMELHIRNGRVCVLFVVVLRSMFCTLHSYMSYPSGYRTNALSRGEIPKVEYNSRTMKMGFLKWLLLLNSLNPGCFSLCFDL